MTDDTFINMVKLAADPAEHAAAITTSDTVVLDNATRAIYVGVAGDLKVDTVGGETVTFTAAPNGMLPIRATRVYATGTAATNLTAMW